MPLLEPSARQVGSAEFADSYLTTFSTLVPYPNTLYDPTR
jgi:hypothetical protein